MKNTLEKSRTMTSQEVTKSLLAFPNEWASLLEEEAKKDYFQNLIHQVGERYLSETVYPPYNQVYRALELTNPKDLKVVIIGQDPYFNPGQANGLAFSVGEGVKFPPSLLNIYKELKIEYGYDIPASGSLEPWARQGVLLLNASLTVHEGEPNSHAKLGWMNFTDDLIKVIDSLDQPVVYLLWGNFAYEKAKLIKNKKAHIIHTAHPSPLSARRGFFHSDCFKHVNEALKSENLLEINWQIK